MHVKLFVLSRTRRRGYLLSTLLKSSHLQNKEDIEGTLTPLRGKVREDERGSYRGRPLKGTYLLLVLDYAHLGY